MSPWRHPSRPLNTKLENDMFWTGESDHQSVINWRFISTTESVRIRLRSNGSQRSVGSCTAGHLLRNDNGIGNNTLATVDRRQTSRLNCNSFTVEAYVSTNSVNYSTHGTLKYSAYLLLTYEAKSSSLGRPRQLWSDNISSTEIRQSSGIIQTSDVFSRTLNCVRAYERSMNIHWSLHLVIVAVR